MSSNDSPPVPINYAEAQQPERMQVKVGLIGDAQIGKTSLMVRYCDGSFDEDYIQTLGVNFLEKAIAIRNTELTFSIWDLGGQREFINMLPIVCNEAAAIIFMFDLTRKSTLNSVRNWYRQARGFNRSAVSLLVGTKFDLFYEMNDEEQYEISEQAKKYAKAMRAPLIFCSTSQGINIAKIFKIIIGKTFDLKLKMPELVEVGEPLVIYSQW